VGRVRPVGQMTRRSNAACLCPAGTAPTQSTQSNPKHPVANLTTSPAHTQPDVGANPGDCTDAINPVQPKAPSGQPHHVAYPHPPGRRGQPRGLHRRNQPSPTQSTQWPTSPRRLPTPTRTSGPTPGTAPTQSTQSYPKHPVANLTTSPSHTHPDVGAVPLLRPHELHPTRRDSSDKDRAARQVSIF